MKPGCFTNLGIGAGQFIFKSLIDSWLRSLVALIYFFRLAKVPVIGDFMKKNRHFDFSSVLRHDFGKGISLWAFGFRKHRAQPGRKNRFH